MQMIFEYSGSPEEYIARAIHKLGATAASLCGVPTGRDSISADDQGRRMIYR
jgi:hypothetical protein